MKRATVALFLATIAGAALTLPADDAAADDLTIIDTRIDSSGDLVMRITERDLPGFESFMFRALARGEATYVCVNAGGEPLPGRQHRQTVRNLRVQDDGTFRSDRDGMLEGRLTLRLNARPTLDCPGRSRIELAIVRFNRIQVTRRGESDSAPYIERRFLTLP